MGVWASSYSYTNALEAVLADAAGRAVVTLDTGGYGLTMPNGLDPFPLVILTGTPTEPKVAGSVQQVVTFDAGADSAHTEILLTFNCTNGADLETADEAIMSQRFASPDSNSEVIKTGITGNFVGGDFPAYLVNARLLHIALRGSGSYTTAAGNAVIPGQAVLLTWEETDAISAVELRFATATGTGNRARQLVVTGYSNS